jgi:hypothetical protein
MTKRPLTNVHVSVFARLKRFAQTRRIESDPLQDLANTNFEFYKRATDDDAFARHFLNWLFERVQKNVKA